MLVGTPRRRATPTAWHRIQLKLPYSRDFKGCYPAVGTTRLNMEHQARTMQETSPARWSPPQASTANPPIPAWVTAEQQHCIQMSSFLEELTALTALSPFYRSVYKLIEALARMPTGDAACTWVQELAAEGTPDSFPQALMTAR